MEYILSIIPPVSRSQTLHADHAISVCRLILSLCLCHGDAKVDDFFPDSITLVNIHMTTWILNRFFNFHRHFFAVFCGICGLGGLLN